MPTDSDGKRGRRQEPLQTAKVNSRTVNAVASTCSHLARLTEHFASGLAKVYRRSGVQRIEQAYSESSPARLARWGAQTARQSWLYRWLTKEPDPDVIVIDLTETVTVGPILVVLERVLVPVSRWTSSAASAQLVQRVANHPVPLASAAFFGVLAGSLLTSWPASPLVLAAYAIGFIAAGLGFAVEDSRTALANSPTAALLAAALEPPEGPRDEQP